MADRTPGQLDFERLKRRRAQTKSGGYEVPSDGASLPLRKLARRPGLIDPVARVLTDPRDPRRITHSLGELLRQRVLGFDPGP